MTIAASAACAQSAVVSGQVFLKDSGEPLGYTAVSVVTRGPQLLTGESGKFMLLALEPGRVQLRFKRIGFTPKDTVLILAAGDTARVKIELTRLALQLPAMLVSGKCTNESPIGGQPAVLAELFDQIHQNAERVKLFADAKPYLLQGIRLFGVKTSRGLIAARMDTILRSPLPPVPYTPKLVVRPGEGVDAGQLVLALPEQSDLADTAFTNNHCLRYAGKTNFDYDSVIRVDFEPVPWLHKEVDIEGSIYIHAESYQLVGLVFKLTRIPLELARAGLLEVSVRARFREIADGIPALAEWEVTNKPRSPAQTRLEEGQIIRVKWRDSTAAKPDTVRRH